MSTTDREQDARRTAYRAGLAALRPGGPTPEDAQTVEDLVIAATVDCWPGGPLLLAGQGPEFRTNLNAMTRGLILGLCELLMDVTDQWRALDPAADPEALVHFRIAQAATA